MGNQASRWVYFFSPLKYIYNFRYTKFTENLIILFLWIFTANQLAIAS